MSIKNKEGSWINRNGKPVPERNIPKHIKRRDKTVTQIMGIVSKLQARMIADKAKTRKLIEQYCKYVANVSDNSDLTPEGNIQLSDYANLNQVSLYTNQLIGFDERLNIAKGLINKCITKWSKGTNANLRVIVDNAFKMDKQGNLNRALILQLFQIEIQDKNWKKAIALIKDSIYTKETKQYLKIAKRNSTEDKFQGVTLDMSTL
jgi:hypothetical protein